MLCLLSSEIAPPPSATASAVAAPIVSACVTAAAAAAVAAPSPVAASAASVATATADLYETPPPSNDKESSDDGAFSSSSSPLRLVDDVEDVVVGQDSPERESHGELKDEDQTAEPSSLASAVIPRWVLPVSFCNMRQNITDLRRRKRNRRRIPKQRRRTKSFVNGDSSGIFMQNDLGNDVAAARSDSEELDEETSPGGQKRQKLISDYYFPARSNVDDIDNAENDKTHFPTPIGVVENDELPLPVLNLLSDVNEVDGRTTNQNQQQQKQQQQQQEQQQQQQHRDALESPLQQGLFSDDDCEDEIAFDDDEDEDDDVDLDRDAGGGRSSSTMAVLGEAASWRCSVALTDVFGRQLRTLSCVGCGGDGAGGIDGLSVDLAGQTVLVVCARCRWWAVRRATFALQDRGGQRRKKENLKKESHGKSPCGKLRLPEG